MPKQKKKALTLYVMTHTQSFYNKRHIFTGWKDSKLTPEGVRNAKMLGRKLAHKDIGLAFVSPLSRALDTAKYILKYHPETRVIYDKRLYERSYGRLAGKSKDKFAREHPDLWPIYHRSYDVPPPGGESLQQVEKRVLAALKEEIALMRREGTNAMIVAHGNALRPIRRHFERLTPAQMMKLEGMYNKVYAYRV